jgi:hypothetical protein
MSYYFQIDQYPTKDFDEIVGEFINGSLSARIDNIIAAISLEEKEAESLPTLSAKTFYEDRETWIQCEKNASLKSTIKYRKESWMTIKQRIEESQKQLTSTQDKEKIRQIASAFVDLMAREEGSPFVKDVDGYGESARDLDFRFFVQIYQKIMGVDLDSMKKMPSMEDWKTFFRSLKTDLLSGEFQRFYVEYSIKEPDQESTRQFCLKLLLTIGNLVKTTINRGWDLYFFNELSEWDGANKALQEKRSAYVQRIVDEVLASK